MITPDTDVIVRLLTRDDEYQYQLAYTLFEKEQIFIPVTIILETEWVLRYAYEFASSEIVSAFRLLFGLPDVEIGSAQNVGEALEWHAGGMDFADALHLSLSRYGDRFVTFDKRLIAKAENLVDFPVTEPISNQL